MAAFGKTIGAAYRLPVFCLALSLLAACGGTSTLTEKALRKQIETTQSAAAEGALLADDVAQDRTTEPFARIHSGELAEQAKSVAEALGQARAPGLESQRRKALETARAVEGALERLHEAPSDRELAGRLQLELGRLAR